MEKHGLDHITKQFSIIFHHACIVSQLFAIPTSHYILYYPWKSYRLYVVPS